jgi:hypothetical protein
MDQSKSRLISSSANDERRIMRNRNWLKVFGWTHANPEEYLDYLARVSTRYDCFNGHEDCSALPQGPCFEDVAELIGERDG